MRHIDALEAVRCAVRSIFVQLGAAEGLQLNEHLLVRDELYCGRRFSVDGLQAIWFVEEDQIKIRAADGTVVRVMSIEDAVQVAATEQRKAA